MTVVLPGDTIPLASSSALPITSIKLGPGLLPSQLSPDTSLTAIRPGALGHLSPSSSSSSSSAADASRSSGKAKNVEGWWVETNSRRYVPAPGDSVIGQITNRGAESYTLTLTASHSATLPTLSFEGATKRHKPTLQIGQLVYCRILSADRFTEPELTCVDPVTGKAEGFGELTTTDERGVSRGTAMLFPVSLGLARSLVRPRHRLLETVAGLFPFEAAVALNGWVWVRASSARQVVAVGRVLREADLRSTLVGSEEVVAWSKRADGEAEEEDEAMQPSDEAGLDADEIVKGRASLSPKRIRQIVAELL